MRVSEALSERICILCGFPCEMDFSHHKSPNPTKSLATNKRRMWDAETSGIFSHTEYT